MRNLEILFGRVGRFSEGSAIGFRKTSSLDEVLGERLFRMALLIGFFLTMFFSLIYWMNGVYSAALGQLLMALAALLALKVMPASEHRVLLSNIVVGVVFLMAWYRIHQLGGLEAPSFFVFIFVPVFTMGFLPSQWSVFWTICFIGLAIGYYFLEIENQDPQTTLSPLVDHVVRLYSIIFAYLITLGIVYGLKVTYQEYQQRLIREKEDKANLLRILTHDLSTPLTLLELHLGEIHRKTPSKHSEKALRAKNILKNLLESARDLESFLSGKRSLQREIVNPFRLIEQIQFLQSEALLRKQIELDVQYQGVPEALQFLGDSRLVTYQVLNNIVSNAIKFSRAHSRISIRFFSLGDYVCCEVEDRGIGMSQALLNRLYSLSAQTTRVGTDGERGTGFGMPIVKVCLERMGGFIEVTSQETPPSGTIVRVFFLAAEKGATVS